MSIRTNNTTEQDIRAIVNRIEASGVDITDGYNNWLEIGFALSCELGESGRIYFHRLSSRNPGYRPDECDKQYTNCLKSHGNGITIRTLFQKAKEAGITIKSSNSSNWTNSSASNCENVQTLLGETEEIEEIDQICIPTFSQEVQEDLPILLKRVMKAASSPQDADILLLGTLTVLSACMPRISGIYAQRVLYPNLFLFVTARASAGKGKLNLCRYLAEPIHNRLREINKVEEDEYRQTLAEYNAAGRKRAMMERPQEPPMRMLFIPANSSATAVYQILGDNEGNGLIFETEGDSLANTFASDYGNYSDGFRKAFHHETISYTRRKDREYVNISVPKLSALLSGTPRQITNLITNAENGLFSRFIFYYLNPKIEWMDVFASSCGQTLEDYFKILGEEYYDFFLHLSSLKYDVRFSFTPEQQAEFNKAFEAWQKEYSDNLGVEFIATVRRHGVITYRIAMIISTIRMMESGIEDSTMVCSADDFKSSMSIASVLIQHAAMVFSMLPKVSTTNQTSIPAEQRKTLYTKLYEALPAEFERKDYCELAESLGISAKTADRVIKRMCIDGRLTNFSFGKYSKT